MEEGFKKKVGRYQISFCQTESYGKSLHGQMRAGYQEPNNKVYIFRINPLPLTNSMLSFLNLQKVFSELKQYSRTVYEDLNSSSFNYRVLEFFPKTFQTQITNFRKNSKYFDEMVQKFLKTYSFFYNMRISHGSLLPSNIGVSFDGKVKLMDFKLPPEESGEKGQVQDFQNFKTFISRVLEKDSNYPYKFNSFNSAQNHNWEHLFSLWHVTSPLQPVYFPRKNYIENIVTGLYKLEASLCQIDKSFQGRTSQSRRHRSQSNGNSSQLAHDEQQTFWLSEVQKLEEVKVSIRLLQLNYLRQSKQQRLERQRSILQQMMSPLSNYDPDYYNSVIIGAIKDFEFYSLDPSQRLMLLSCLIPNLNHQYIYQQITQELKDNAQHKERNLLLGDSIFSKFKAVVLENLLGKLT